MMNKSDNKGAAMIKTAVVTGGSHNIGQGIAIVLAEHGYDVAITYNHRREGAEETQKEVEKLGRRCFIYQASLEHAEVPQKVMDQAYRDLGRIDLLVCNAGNGGFRGSVLSVTPEEVNQVYEVNFRNYILCAGAAARYMVADGIPGNIIFVTSSRWEMAYPDDYLYGGFKACVERASRSMALDLSSYNIRVNCIAPGATWNPPPELQYRVNSPFVKESIPLHRVGSPRDNGEAVAFLASDQASYITGITIRVDGGLILPGMLEGTDKIPWVREEWKQKMYDQAMEMMKNHKAESGDEHV